MGGSITLSGTPIQIEHLSDRNPGFYIDDERSCDARLIHKAEDGTLVDLGQVALVSFEHQYAILKQGRTKVLFDQPELYTVTH